MNATRENNVMTTTNTTRMDAELSWFYIHYEKDGTGKASDMAVDPLAVLVTRFPDAERRSLRELCDDLRASGPWVPKSIPASYWQGGY